MRPRAVGAPPDCTLPTQSRARTLRIGAINTQSLQCSRHSQERRALSKDTTRRFFVFQRLESSPTFRDPQGLLSSSPSCAPLQAASPGATSRAYPAGETHRQRPVHTQRKQESGSVGAHKRRGKCVGSSTRVWEADGQPKRWSRTW